MSFALRLSLCPHRLLKPAQHHQQLMVDHVRGVNRHPAGLGVGINQTLKPLRASEGLSVAAGHNCQIVGGVADSGEFPVDDAQVVRLPIPENVLRQEIPVEQNGWSILGQVISHPTGHRSSIRILSDEFRAEGVEPGPHVRFAVLLA